MVSKSLYLPVCRVYSILLAVCLVSYASLGQSEAPQLTSAAGAINKISDKEIFAMEKKMSSLGKAIHKQTDELIARMEKKENSMQGKLRGIDSVRSQQYFGETNEKYRQLKQGAQLTVPPADMGIAEKLRAYMPGMDSLQTALHFLQQNKTGISPEKLAQLQAVSSQIQQVQARLQAASAVQTYLKDRESYLKQQLAGFPMRNKLTAVNKEAYYYQQRIAQFKHELNDGDKLQLVILNLAATQPTFQKFWQKNSLLASMFPIGDNGDTVTDKSLAGLQTRAQVNQLIAEKTGKADPASGKTAGDGQGYLSQQVESAKSQMDVLKNKVRQLGMAGNSGEIVMPDFVPNNQRTRSFLKRIEYGFNLQNSSSSNLLPATSSIGILLGYKLSDKITIGTGVAYLLGWGRPMKDVHFSSQGIGLRGYADLKIKGSFWATGGFEYNYRNAFTSLPSLSRPDAWQKSALVGLAKKYKLGNKNANLQLLFDLLAGRQVPAMSPLKFRIGYSF